MIRTSLSMLALVAMTACAPAIPDSGPPVGFDNIDRARTERDAALTSGRPAPLTGDTSVAAARAGAASRDRGLAAAAEAASAAARTPRRTTEVPSTAQLAGGSLSAPTLEDAREAAAAAEARAANSGVDPLQASPDNPPPESHAGISDENDFSAVSQRETIESDAERIRRNAARYTVIQPGELPKRPDGTVNIVAYALKTTHPVGTQLYPRSAFRSKARTARNCSAYVSADEAQVAFLTMGGPQRDPKALDPDGDGYACDWDPTPFRVAVGR